MLTAKTGSTRMSLKHNNNAINSKVAKAEAIGLPETEVSADIFPVMKENSLIFLNPCSVPAGETTEARPALKDRIIMQNCIFPSGALQQPINKCSK